MNVPLLLLHLRRAMSPWLGISLGVVALLLGTTSELPETVRLAAPDPEQAARGLLRAAWWTTLALLLLAAAVQRAAGEHTRWRGGEALWQSTRRRGPLTVAASVWAGRTLGLTLWLLAIGVAGELAADGAAPSWELGPPRAATALQDDPARAVFHWSADLGELERGARARVELRWRGDYSSVDALELGVRRPGGETSTRRTRPGLVHLAEVDLPPGSGPLEFQLTAEGARSRLAIGELTIELLRPAPERAGAWRVGLGLALFGATLVALALGLGAWMSAASAFVLLAVSYSAAWLQGSRWPVPGLELPRLLAGMESGRVPAATPLEVWIVGAALIALGLWLRALALRRGCAS